MLSFSIARRTTFRLISFPPTSMATTWLIARMKAMERATWGTSRGSTRGAARAPFENLGRIKEDARTALTLHKSRAPQFCSPLPPPVLTERQDDLLSRFQHRQDIP